MTNVLLCTQADLEPDLGHTLLWRHDIERHQAARLEEARMMAVAARPSLVVVDRDMPRSDKLVAQLREDEATRALSIVVLARGDFDPVEVEFLEAGANAILRIPAGPDWDDRLVRLMQVPARKEVRLPVQFAVEGVPGNGGSLFPALAVNLSFSGLLLESHLSLAIGDEVGLLFRLPNALGPVSAMGRVVRQAAPTQFGVEFRRFDGDGQVQVRQFVGTLSA